MKIFGNLFGSRRRGGQQLKAPDVVKAAAYEDHYHARGVMYPRSPVDFEFHNLVADEYLISIEYTDEIVQRLRRNLSVQFLVDGKPISPAECETYNIAYNDTIGSHLELDFGRYHSGRIQHVLPVRLPTNCRKITLRIALNSNRIFNIDHIKIYPQSGKYPDSSIGMMYQHGVRNQRVRIRNLEREIGRLRNAVRALQSFSSEIPSNYTFPRLSSVVDKFDRCSANGDRIFVIHSGIDLNIVDGSSIWVSNIVNILSRDNIVIVCAPKVIRSQIITSQFRYINNTFTIDPSFAFKRDQSLDAGASNTISQSRWLEMLKELDDRCGSNLFLVVRGMPVADAVLSDRYFYRRVLAYLTDFYAVEDGEYRVSEEAKAALFTYAKQAGGFLFQTEAIGALLEKYSRGLPSNAMLPPSLPLYKQKLVPRDQTGRSDLDTLNIVYAGKISPEWGVEELLEYAIKRKSESRPINVTLIANKVSANKDVMDPKAYRQKIDDLIALADATHIKNMNRKQVQWALQDADFVWAYRPASLEEGTLEISTKLIEAVALGCRTICYPNALNTELLGEDYPFFARGPEDFETLFAEIGDVPAKTIERVRQKHDPDRIRDELFDSDVFKGLEPVNRSLPVICFAVHDSKFVDPYINNLKMRGYSILRDSWNWGRKNDIEVSIELAEKADIIFCEWGLANAVWHSRNNDSKKPLFIRIHLQEINERAQAFGYEIEIENVTKIIFVSERVKDVAKEMFGWPEEKLCVINNFVLDNEFDLGALPEQHERPAISLGMVGITPQRKRFDRAIDVLVELRARGHDAVLRIKGPRPEELDHMNAPGRAAEIEFYNEQYDRIGAEALDEYVTFEPWGNDMSYWYKSIDYILSPSDFESFHYAVADGVLSGCHPILWPWEEASLIYKDDWIVESSHNAVERILAFEKSGNQSAVQQENHDFIVEKYGQLKIFPQLDTALGLTPR